LIKFPQFNYTDNKTTVMRVVVIISDGNIERKQSLQKCPTRLMKDSHTNQTS